MIVLALLLSAPPHTPDSIPLEDVIRRIEAHAPSVGAAVLRRTGAEDRASAAGRWNAPSLEVVVQNVGNLEGMSGSTGVRGLEGDVALALPVPLGGERFWAREGARAALEAAVLEERQAVSVARAAGLDQLVVALEARARAETAEVEREGMQQLAGALALQAAEGMTSEGDAARARLAAVQAATRAARRRADAARAVARTAPWLGLAPTSDFRVALPESCMAPGAGGVATPLGRIAARELPGALAAEFRAREAEAAGREARAAALPDLQPLVGFRREGGESAAILGIQVGLPIPGRERTVARAADREARARALEHRWTAKEVEAAHSGARAALDLLEAAGAGFDSAWLQALDRTVEGATARFEAGEGSLVDLLESRRARLEALDDFESWKAELRTERLRVAALEGGPVDVNLFCGGAE